MHISLFRYNNFKEDPLSKCDGCDPPANGENAISARSDLNPANGTYPFGALRQRSHGGTDMKVLTVTLLKTFDSSCLWIFCTRKRCLRSLIYCVIPFNFADDLLRDVPWLWYGSSEWANVGPGASISVEHFPLQRPDAHGASWHLGIQAYKSQLDSIIVVTLYLQVAWWI